MMQHVYKTTYELNFLFLCRSLRCDSDVVTSPFDKPQLRMRPPLYSDYHIQPINKAAQR